MRRHIRNLFIVAVLLAAGFDARAQMVVSNGIPSCPGGSCRAPQRGCSLKQLCAWLTYRPRPVPLGCQCRNLNPVCTPPLYLYFIGEYGPRSPELYRMAAAAAQGTGGPGCACQVPFPQPETAPPVQEVSSYSTKVRPMPARDVAGWRGPPTYTGATSQRWTQPAATLAPAQVEPGPAFAPQVAHPTTTSVNASTN